MLNILLFIVACIATLDGLIGLAMSGYSGTAWNARNVSLTILYFLAVSALWWYLSK